MVVGAGVALAVVVGVGVVQTVVMMWLRWYRLLWLGWGGNYCSWGWGGISCCG